MITKKLYIENLRIISMIAVVLTHIGSTAETDFPDSFKFSMEGVLFTCVVNLMHFAVPIFFMISGALLVDPEKEMSIDKLLKKYVLKYAMVLLIFGSAYAFIEEIFANRDFQVSYIFIAIWNMLQGKSWAHLWYMYTLLGVMLCLPVLRAMISSFSDETLYYIVLLYFVFLSVIPLLEKNIGVTFGVSLSMGSIYCFYMLLGYMLDQKKIVLQNREAKGMLGVSVVVLVIAAYIRVMYEYQTGLADYNSPVIVLYAVSLFGLLFNTTAKNANGNNHIFENIKRILADTSFGVYLVHMFWINLFFKLFHINPYELPFIVSMIGLGGVVLICAVLSTLFLQKIPGIKRLI